MDRRLAVHREARIGVSATTLARCVKTLSILNLRSLHLCRDL